MTVYYTFDTDGPVPADDYPLCFRAEDSDSAFAAMRLDCAAADAPLAGAVALATPTVLASFGPLPTADDLAEVARCTGIEPGDLRVVVAASAISATVVTSAPIYGPLWADESP